MSVDKVNNSPAAGHGANAYALPPVAVDPSLLYQPPLIPPMATHNQFMPGMQYGMPYYGVPINPYEKIQGQLYMHEEGTKGLKQGAVLGGAGGALTGAAVGFFVGGPVGAAIGAVAGGLSGLFGGAAGGKKLAEYQAVHHDALDDGRMNGSPLLYGGGH